MTAPVLLKHVFNLLWVLPITIHILPLVARARAVKGKNKCVVCLVYALILLFVTLTHPQIPPQGFLPLSHVYVFDLWPCYPIRGDCALQMGGNSGMLGIWFITDRTRAWPGEEAGIRLWLGLLSELWLSIGSCESHGQTASLQTRDTIRRLSSSADACQLTSWPFGMTFPLWCINLG